MFFMILVSFSSLCKHTMQFQLVIVCIWSKTQPTTASVVIRGWAINEGSGNGSIDQFLTHTVIKKTNTKDKSAAEAR